MSGCLARDRDDDDQGGIQWSQPGVVQPAAQRYLCHDEATVREF